MRDPLRDFYQELGREPVPAEFEARLEKALTKKRAAFTWVWVVAPALAAYIFVVLLASLPSTGTPQASKTGEPLMGRLTASR